MKLAKVFAMSIFLSGCAGQGQKKGVDDYRFDGKEYEHTEITVKVVLARNDSDMRKLAKAHGLRPERVTAMNRNYVTQAFSILHPRDRDCIIFTMDPDWSYQPEYLGHELAHCIWGRWHDPVK